MDSGFLIQQLRQFIFTLASHGDVVFLGTLGIAVFGLGPIGRALAARLRGVQAGSDEALKSGLAEVQERLDFSERILGELRARLLGSGAADQPTPRRATTPV